MLKDEGYVIMAKKGKQLRDFLIFVKSYTYCAENVRVFEDEAGKGKKLYDLWKGEGF